MRSHRTTAPLFALMLLMLSADLAVAQVFRVKSKVFSGSREVSQSLAVFDEKDVVYDFQLVGDREVTVFDPQRQRIILVNPAKKQQTHISMPILGEHVEEMRNSPQAEKHPLLFDPKFETEYDADKGLKLENDRIKYQAKGIKAHKQEYAARYQRFVDWAARLNAFLPGNHPPFARIVLNEQLAQRGELPAEITLTIKNRFQFDTVRSSKHEILWKISSEDRQKIETVGRYLSEFQTVEFREYHGLN